VGQNSAPEVVRRRRIQFVSAGAAVAVLAAVVALFATARQSEEAPEGPWLVTTDGRVETVYECMADPAIQDHYEFFSNPSTGLTIVMVPDATRDDLDRVLDCVSNAVKGTGVDVHVLTNPNPDPTS